MLLQRIPISSNIFSSSILQTDSITELNDDSEKTVFYCRKVVSFFFFPVKVYILSLLIISFIGALLIIIGTDFTKPH